MRKFAIIAAFVLVTSSAAAQTPPAAAQAEQHFSAALGPNAPSASFELQLEAGQIVTLTTASDKVDTILTLNGPNGRQIAQNDDQLPGILNSRIIYVARASGRHTAVVTGYGGAFGPFELNIAYGVNVGLSGAARRLREERFALDRRHADLRFPVELNANDIFVASTLALTDTLDTTLTLRDASGAIVMRNDDRGDGTLNSQLVYQAGDAGHFELEVSSYDGRGVGDFMLSLALDPNAEAPFNFASIHGEAIGRHEGELNDAQPSRQYPVELAAGQTLLAVSDTTSGNLDTVLTLNDAEGYPVALNDDRGDGSLNSGFAFTAPHAGAYTLEISRYAQSQTSGAYRLVLSSVDRSAVDTLRALLANPVALSGPEQTVESADFRVYYTLEGTDASTPEYARATAETMQRVLDTQVNRVGWAAPVRDPDGRFHAYVANANGEMGYTKSVEMVFDNPNTPNVRERAAALSVFVIDNDFANMGKKAPPESLMHATVTHEFNHVVQASYDARESLGWLFEATATWTETTTVGSDQDATDYVATDLEAPELCWTTNAPGHTYAQWTLLQSLADSYGEHFIVQLWENTIPYDGFEVMSRTLAAVGATTPDAIRRWREQNFALDYALAPLFGRTVQLGGAISRDGRWSPRARIEQLGASYIALRIQGPRAFELRGDDNLELVGLGVRNGQVEVSHLGRGGVFDTSGFSYAALMVFNHAMPEQPGACRAVTYSINVSPTNAAMAPPQYHFNAAYFRPPA